MQSLTPLHLSPETCSCSRYESYVRPTRDPSPSNIHPSTRVPPRAPLPAADSANLSSANSVLPQEWTGDHIEAYEAYRISSTQANVANGYGAAAAVVTMGEQGSSFSFLKVRTVLHDLTIALGRSH